METKNYSVEPPSWDHGVTLPDHLKDGGKSWEFSPVSGTDREAGLEVKEGTPIEFVTVAVVPGRVDHPITRATARLISQAPKLLVALMKEHGWNDPQHMDAMPNCEVCASIRACFEPSSFVDGQA